MFLIYSFSVGLVHMYWLFCEIAICKFLSVKFADFP